MTPAWWWSWLSTGVGVLGLWLAGLLAAAGLVLDRLPRGRVLAVVRVVAVVRTDPGPRPVGGWQPAPWEASVGDWRPGRWAWLLEDVTPLAVPVLARGAQGLWPWHPWSRWEGGEAMA